MATCILHIGPPKTGTSSIQESLFFGLNDPRFHYVNLGGLNAATFLIPLFASDARQHLILSGVSYSETRIRRMRQRYDRRLRRVLRRCHSAGVTPILSSEYCWNAPDDFLTRLRDYLLQEGYTARLIAYLRPYKSWLESNFQQRTKNPPREVDVQSFFSREMQQLLADFSQRLSRFERIFGTEALTVRPFVRKALAGGCAVQDFCETFGIQFDPGSIIRANDSLGVDAVRLLHAYNLFHRPAHPISMLTNARLVRQLLLLQGDPLHFHSRFVEPLVDFIAKQTDDLHQRYGIDLREDITAFDNGPCIRDMADLQRYSREALDWLADCSRQSPIETLEGEETARRVALQVAALAKRPLLRWHADSLMNRARFRIRWARYGD